MKEMARRYIAGAEGQLKWMRKEGRTMDDLGFADWTRTVEKWSKVLEEPIPKDSELARLQNEVLKLQSVLQENEKNKKQEIADITKEIESGKDIKIQTEDELRVELGLKPKPRPISTPVLQPPPALAQNKGQTKIKPTLSKATPPPPTIAPNVSNAKEVPIHVEEENPTNVEPPPFIQQQEEQAQVIEEEEIAQVDEEKPTPKRRSTRPEQPITQDEVIGTEVATGILKTQIPAIVKELRKFNQRAMATMAAAPRRRFGR
jgi:hypothetical protein